LAAITIEDIKGCIDYDEATRIITKFLKDYLDTVGAKGFVVGLSGGVDSSTSATLAVKAVGSDNVVGLIMPDKTSTPLEDVEDARALAKLLGIRYHEVLINDFLENYTKLPFYDPSDKVSLGNVKARIRMTLLYYYANTHNYLVLGTGDKSELLLGYYTKYGDGGVDILPIGDLYKTQVRVLALKLDIPSKIARKPSSPRLWPGQMAESELGLSYETIDLVLYAYFDLRIKPSDIPRATGVSRDVVREILRRVKATEHKRRPPPIPRISRRSLRHDIRLPLHP